MLLILHWQRNNTNFNLPDKNSNRIILVYMVHLIDYKTLAVSFFKTIKNDLKFTFNRKHGIVQYGFIIFVLYYCTDLGKNFWPFGKMRESFSNRKGCPGK
jgi:hypothetical protein